MWEEVDLDVMEALEEYWLDEPPVGLTVAKFLGVKPRKKKDSKKLGDLKELLSLFPDGNIKGSG